MRPTILVIEDDPAIRRGVADALAHAGYAAIEAADGDVGLEAALRRDYDLLLLDLVLPGRGGLEILREVRAVRATLPVIILTALGGEDDRVVGLRLGADDYMVKPFSVRELLARVEAVRRRTPERPEAVDEVAIPGGKVHLDRLEVAFADGERVELSVREADLLRYLAGRPGKVVPRGELLARVWRVDPRTYETRTVDVHVARLRLKLRDDSNRPRLIFTIRGKGYRFAPEGGP